MRFALRFQKFKTEKLPLFKPLIIMAVVKKPDITKKISTPT